LFTGIAALYLNYVCKVLEYYVMSIVDSALNIFSLSLIFAIIGLNVYLTTSVMNITDLTCDGSVALGGCAYGAFVACGVNPILAFVFATFFGVIAGFTTSSLTNYINIEPVVASIITLSAVQTFILKLNFTGQAYLSSLGGSLSKLTPIDNTILIAFVVAAISFVFYRVMNSEYGLAMKVFGDGKIISESLGINCNKIMWVGLGIANGLAAAAGAMIAQVMGSFSVSMGTGSLVFGITSVIIGQKLISDKTPRGAIVGCFMGAFIYKGLLELFTIGGIEAFGHEYNSIITAVVLIFLMASINDNNKKGNLENF
jgi:putative ABC transport system permease protein